MTDLLKFRYIYISVIIFLFSDMLILFFPELKGLRTSWYLKGLVVLYYLFVFVKESSKFQKGALSILSIFFLTSQSILYFTNKMDINQILENTRLFVWYIVLLILYSLFFKVLKHNFYPEYIRKLNRVAYGIIAIVCVFILIGYIFEIDFLKTYGGVRWGYKGVIIKSVTLSYVLIIMLFFVYYQFIVKTNKPLYLIIPLFCALLSGTKTTYAFIILLFCCHVLYWRLYRKKTFWGSIIVVSVFFILFNGVILDNTKFTWGLFYELYLDKGFLYSLSSFRSEILVDVSTIYLEKWQIYNYLIGGPLDIGSYEMALFDLLSFFGLLGSAIYLYYFKTSFLDQFLKTTGALGGFIIGALVLAAFFTGQFLVNSTVIICVWFYLIVFKLNFNEKSKKEEYSHE